eukprot:1962560-Rhodomonas_salina.2
MTTDGVPSVTSQKKCTLTLRRYLCVRSTQHSRPGNHRTGVSIGIETWIGRLFCLPVFTPAQFVEARATDVAQQAVRRVHQTPNIGHQHRTSDIQHRTFDI